MPSRLEILKTMVEQNPADAFARYGLAMELRNTGDLQGAANEFATLRSAHPDYVPAYYHAGQTLERMGRIDDARAIYQAGIEAASRNGDNHAKSELQTALDLL